MPALNAVAALLSVLIVAAPRGERVATDTLRREFLARDVVYVGEQHDQASHHAVQLEMLQLHPGRRVVLGLEMLDVTQQGTLDDWQAGRLSDADFEKFWKKAWGYEYGLYRGLLEHARASGIPVKALNAPIAVVRQVAKGGLASLTPEQRRLLPADIRPITDPRYLAYVKKALGEHGPMPPAAEARMLEAMAVWNETMGQSVVDAAAGGTTVFVAAGMGHMLFKAGILESVGTRSGLRQTVVLPYPLDAAERPAEELLRTLRQPDGDIQLADFFRLLPSSAQPRRPMRTPRALEHRIRLDLSRLDPR